MSDLRKKDGLRNWAARRPASPIAPKSKAVPGSKSFRYALPRREASASKSPGGLPFSKALVIPLKSLCRSSENGCGVSSPRIRATTSSASRLLPRFKGRPEVHELDPHPERGLVELDLLVRVSTSECRTQPHRLGAVGETRKGRSHLGRHQIREEAPGTGSRRHRPDSNQEKGGDGEPADRGRGNVSNLRLADPALERNGGSSARLRPPAGSAGRESSSNCRLSI